MIPPDIARAAYLIGAFALLGTVLAILVGVNCHIGSLR